MSSTADGRNGTNLLDGCEDRHQCRENCKVYRYNLLLVSFRGRREGRLGCNLAVFQLLANPGQTLTSLAGLVVGNMEPAREGS